MRIKWTKFTTINTSGYDQSLGETTSRKGATMVWTDENYSVELNNKLIHNLNIWKALTYPAIRLLIHHERLLKIE